MYLTAEKLACRVMMASTLPINMTPNKLLKEGTGYETLPVNSGVRMPISPSRIHSIFQILGTLKSCHIQQEQYKLWTLCMPAEIDIIRPLSVAMLAM